MSEKQLENVVKTTFTQSSLENKLQDNNGVSSTLLARDYKDPKLVIDSPNISGNNSFIAIKEAIKKGYSIASEGDEVYIHRPHQKRGVVQKGMTPTIKTSAHDIGVVVMRSDKRLNLALSKIVDNETKIIDTYNQTFHKETMPTIRTTINSSNTTFLHHELRIRKLTPREALRLMDVSENDIDIILSNVSETQAYKLAGNSIVVNVLVEIFKKIIEVK